MAHDFIALMFWNSEIISLDKHSLYSTVLKVDTLADMILYDSFYIHFESFLCIYSDMAEMFHTSNFFFHIFHVVFSLNEHMETFY